ncbi:hypothetical protein ACJQWK_06798 [Exserohilum turcicum]|uniref:Carboxypeptidase n=1 Tax=Exserohilum turcicum (strain 28A) TaxID=671987 RepID=R0JIQ5_EXST2|nr:uncharacterized protein SETTUDRAFT_185131 [Exserohilum turcica Et28A]EOA81223.1 hypothetical protein SETTUDRAFT_185131 [Exserohilum turcica Et28A]
MKLISIFASLLCASTAVVEAAPRKPATIWKRPKPLIERRVAGRDFSNPEIQKRAQSYFATAKTKPFAVDGKAFPEVNFDIGESYAGLLPISNDPKETRKLFFWFFPAKTGHTPEEIVIWLNGGPGCSSLIGLLDENGPFTWQQGTLAPTPNPYSWNNITNMLWVEQPVGVGYSEGVPNITNEVELSKQFRGFYKNFVDTFHTYNWKTYITGESYAGMYVPNIANSFIKANDKKYFNLAGISINDPVLGDNTIQQQVVILPFVQHYQNIFGLNDTFMAAITKKNRECGYAQYLDKYFRFPPPKGPFPVLPDPYAGKVPVCDMIDDFGIALSEINPCFNIYHVTDTCPFVYDVMGIVNTGDYSPPGIEIYFNRTDVKKALHVNPNTNWMQCTDVNVFANGNENNTDTSLPPTIDGTLQNVIEHTNNVLIGSGDLDMLIATNGSLFALQNMTWHGVQGFSKYPCTPLYAPYHPEWNGGSLAGAGYLGKWIKERGLTFYTSFLAGHEVPQYTPGVGLRMLEILLGHVKDFSSTDNFVGQNGQFTGTIPIYKRDD